MSNLQAVPPERRRNAKTRASTLCKNWGMRYGWCRMHGGKSYGGYASPRLVHGWYSNCFPFSIMRAAVKAHERRQRFVEREMARLEAAHPKRERRLVEDQKRTLRVMEAATDRLAATLQERES